MAAVPSIGRASLVEPAARAPQAAVTAGLYERHSGKLFGYCYHQLGSREEAEDAVQTTFMNAFRALGRGVVPESETAWLYKIAENVCLSRRRSSWRRGRIESPSDFEVIEEIVPGPSRQRDELIGIEDALASMPEQQRRAILLREWQGLSYREIAEELEVSQSAVETLIFRARRSLAQGLEQPESLKPKRKSLRRALHMIDLGTIAAALKTLLAGSAAAKATAAAVAVTAAAGTAAGVGHELESKRHAPFPAKEAVVAPAPAAKASVTTPSIVVRSAASTSVTAAGPDPAVAPKAKAKVARKPAQGAPAPAVEARPQPRPALTAPAAAVPPAAEPVSEAVPAPPAPQSAAGTSRPAEPSGGEQKRPTQAEPTERKAEKQAERREEKRGNREEQGPPAPSAVTAPVTLIAAARDERERGKGRRKEPKADAAPLPVPTPVEAAAPVPGEQPAPAAPPPWAQPAAETAAPSAPAPEAGPEREREDRGNGNGRRRK